ncbi:MAG: RHS repeat-associated core domain-containing protein, partial [Planctomycetes bacterium]|nr:RHS repeat-associated core domain-containing protein [Planctomycetota bacterium]
TSFGFTDQEHDPTGLIYMNARYYDPLCARFTQPDDIIQDPFDPQFLNRYTYVRNNPVRFVDPSGLIVTAGAVAAGNEVLNSSIFIAGPGTGAFGIIALSAFVGVGTIVAMVLGLLAFRGFFHDDSDNGRHGVVGIDVIQSQYLAPFKGLIDGVKAIGSGLETFSIKFSDSSSGRSYADRVKQGSIGLLKGALGAVGVTAGTALAVAGLPLLGVGVLALPFGVGLPPFVAGSAMVSIGLVGVVDSIDNIHSASLHIYNSITSHDPVKLQRQVTLVDNLFGDNADEFRKVAAISSLTRAGGRFLSATGDFFRKLTVAFGTYERSIRAVKNGMTLSGKRLENV